MPNELKKGERPLVARDAQSFSVEEHFRSAYDENGVDRSLIRWSLRRTATERVKALENSLNALATVRRIDPPR